MNIKLLMGVVLGLLFSLNISACGQKGPLYLPGTRATTVDYL